MSELAFTGERYVPELDWPDISYEHWHRYLYAAEFAAGKQVLDIACGEGYGSSVLAEVADRVVGVDIDPEIVGFAARKYQRANLEFRAGPAHAIPVDQPGVFDLLVTFETLEHMSEEHQLQFLKEAKRLLKPEGVLLLSTPNKLLYTDEPNYSNPFHVKELYRGEFHDLLLRYFHIVKIFGQTVYPVSYIWPVADRVATISEHQLVFSCGRFTPVKGDEKQLRYMLAACSDVEQALTRGSLLIDLSHRLTAKLQEHISERDRAVEGLQVALDEQKATTDLRVREAEAFADRIRQLETEAARAASHAAELDRDVATRNEMIQELQIQLQSQGQQLLDARAEVADLRPRVEELQRHHDELLGAKLQSESEVGRLQAVLEERTSLIGRLERTSAWRDDLLRQLERELADRAAWACRTVDELVSAHLTQEPPRLRELELIAAADTQVHPSAQTVDTGSNLELMRQALEAEQTERQRLERIVSKGYTHLKRRIGEAVERLVPRRSTVVIVSKGDDDLVRLNGRRGWHFPQTERGVYAGHYPADSTAAIDHLEHLRAKGAQFLVFPAPSCWWLDHYSQFADHLVRHYRRILERDDVGVVFDLRRRRAPAPDWKTDLGNMIEEFQAGFRRDPAILDCETGLDVASSFPQHMVFSPPDEASVLPYLDSTVDVVVCRAGSPRAREARRVVKTLLLTATAATNGARRTPGAVRLRAEWLARKHARTSPAVSIIIPCHNGVRLTQSCLAAVEATLSSSLHGEVIVVDDASTDGTRAMLARWAKRNNHVRVLRNSRNIGFVRSCNRAAKAARGEMLVLLNNDTQPARGWLTALLRTFDDHPDAGAVGGKLVFPDGTLQEAGSLVFRDGSAANFGRGDRNPDHPLFNHVRQVDYCSAALLATPRRLFLELGGFDSCYVPAYYEDTDYCFKLRDKGYRVYYQPAARVIHHEGASCGKDLTQGAKRHQTVNREKFRDRWKTALERQPERPQHENFDAWQRLAVRSA
jgi:GT2 family glycosyltransferase/SAM-dependent methyltransferase